MKLKTKKAASKRFHASSKGKVQRLKVKQAHFNARASGNDTRAKHGRKGISSTDRGRIERLVPYQKTSK